jgi:integrase
VQVKLNAALAGLNKGIRPVQNERQTVGQFLTRWMEDTARPSVRFSTAKGYESKLRIHILPGLGSIPVTKLTPQRLEAFFNAKLSEGLAPQTVQHLRAILRAALNDALKWNLVARNVAAIVDGPRVSPSEIQPFTPEEARRLLSAVQDHRLGALFSVAIAVGLRQGEALGLRWQDVDLDSGTISVRFALQRMGKEFTLVEPKTRKSRRTIALPGTAVASLRAHRTRQLEERLAAGSLWEESDLVFTTPTGRPLQGQNATRSFQQLLVKMGLRRQRFHDLRHACASLLLAQGVHPRVVMETLGHSQIGLTMNTYSHVIPALQREAAMKMDALLTAH